MLQHDFPYDPTYGYDLPALLEVGAPPAPNDLASFWLEMSARTRAIDPRPTMRQLPSDRTDARTYEIEYDSLDGFRVGGWLTVPTATDAPTRGLVLGHGYGGREAPGYGEPWVDAVTIQPCGRGFHRSARPDLPNTGGRHVLHGIGNRDTYLHGKCVADFWAGLNVLQAMFPSLRHFDYAGTSFGGGIGALALPWDARWRRAFLEVPSFGNHPLRVTLRCGGSGEAVRLHHQRHPEVLEVLRYFDAATAAAQTRIPVMVSAAKFDPVVPPPGQFAVYNALAGPRQLFVSTAGHFTYPDEVEEARARTADLTAFFATPADALTRA